MWRPVRATGAGPPGGHLPPLLGWRARTADLLAGPPVDRRRSAGLQSPRAAAKRGLLWRGLPIALALTHRLARLRQSLTDHSPVEDDDPSLIWAAVAVILAPDPDAILLIRRAERTGDPWSGHIALPGGRREPGDPDLVATAIRETGEELGVRLDRGDLAGSLEDVVPRTPALPPIAVRPSVFILPAQPSVTPNDEVASAHWVRVDYLLRPDTYHPVRLEVAGQSRQVQAYQLEDGIVWGMTERILTSLLSRF